MGTAMVMGGRGQIVTVMVTAMAMEMAMAMAMGWPKAMALPSPRLAPERGSQHRPGRSGRRSLTAWRWSSDAR